MAIAKRRPSKVTRAPEKVLLVEDDPVALVAMARDLGFAFEPIVAETSEDALQILRRDGSVRAIICHLNHQRGRISAPALLAEAARIAPRCARIVFARQARWDGYDDFAHAFLQRPWQPGILRSTVRRALRRVAG
jgi:DNA-binding NtrC family response regulator